MEMYCGRDIEFVKPLICNNRNIALDPTCFLRSDHLLHTNKFIDNKFKNASTFSNWKDDHLTRNISEVNREQCNYTKDDFFKSLKSDVQKLENDVNIIMNRISTIKNRVQDDLKQRLTKFVDMEETINEIVEREKRSSNIILFNMEENYSCSSLIRNFYEEFLIKNILHEIDPTVHIISCPTRIGRECSGKIRPVRVILASKNEVISILKNKCKYRGPVQITQDCTKAQRDHLKLLQIELELLKENGVFNKTITFINGVPKIVNKQ